MASKRFNLFLLFSLFIIGLMSTAAPALAQGIILPPPDWPQPQPGVFTDPSWLKINYHRAYVEIDNQIATTNVDMKFTNQGEALAEGTFVFPLPEGAAVDQLVMYVDGQAIEAKILPADEARQVYDEIVRQYRDPALLEYIGSGAIQANIFPIPPGDERRIEFSYQQVLEVDNGLIHYIYPLHANTGRQIDEMTITVDVQSNDPISSVYSPSHPIALSRDEDDKGFRAGFEETYYQPGDDFSLYYGIASDTINVNLLTYREGAREDGFFMLLVQPPLTVPDDQIVPKDVIIVLDQSGSMQGQKWEQAQDAAIYVLEQLNPRDRFNVIVFSTGSRLYSEQTEDASLADDAIDWIRGLRANGGTDINLAMTQAMDLAHVERPTTVLFLTDGVPTEGETDMDDILDNLRQRHRDNVRVFSFGVGDDVNTFLLDTMVQAFRGTGSYVRPSEHIDEEVASLYNKISAPVLNDITLDFGSLRAELIYPQQLPDLFAGEQLTIVGRYRDGLENTTISLSGKVEGQMQSFNYVGLDFRERAGGEPFIARLWATRRIADLLNNIRLNGENAELVDSIVDLSLRYGIITPYTSFLIEEDDILSQQGRERAADDFIADEARVLNQNITGSTAVDNADALNAMEEAEAPMAPSVVFRGGSGEGDAENAVSGMPPMAAGTPTPAGTMPAPMGSAGQSPASDADAPNAIQTVNDKTFINIAGIWNDTVYDSDTMETVKIEFLSDDYFDLLLNVPELGDYLALGENVIVVWEGVAYEIVSDTVS